MPPTDGGSGIKPSVPLGVALIIVGLAPSFPVLQRVEDSIRLLAHRLAGIPTWIIRESDNLNRNALHIAQDVTDGIPAETLLIPLGAWERMAHYRKAAEGELTTPEEFHHHLELIFAVYSWVLDRKLALANPGRRQVFEPLEENLRQRTKALVRELDDKAAFLPSKNQAGAGPTKANVFEPEEETNSSIEMLRKYWERLASEVPDPALDICILLVLYVEQEIIFDDTHQIAALEDKEGLPRQYISA